MKQLLVFSLIFSSLGACSFKKDNTGSSGSAQTPNLNEITEADWTSSEETVGKVKVLTRELSVQKLESIRKSFNSPDLSQVSLLESDGYDLFYSSGYPATDNYAFINPKVYVSTSTDKGAIIGYKTGELDGKGRELISVSIPVAIVNGLVNSIPLIGGSGSGVEQAISLPPKYVIRNLNALSAAVTPKKLQTLPVCPQVFRLSYKGKEYRAFSPFKNLSICPFNQFFRVVFKAPIDEMRALLEAAAIQDESVTIVTDMSAQFAMPKRMTTITIDQKDFYASLKKEIGKYTLFGVDSEDGALYQSKDIESAVQDALFSIIKTSGLDPQYSDGMPRILSDLVDNYFSTPTECVGGGICRSVLSQPMKRTSIPYSWTEAEALSTPIETQAISSLGAVANSSDFIGSPSWTVMQMENMPPFFSGKLFNQIASECSTYQSSTASLTAIGLSPDQVQTILGYCQIINDRKIGSATDGDNGDGYYPLGSNTTVYPGAWVKLDVDEISEFTTAKTKQNADGSMQVESEVRDLMAGVDAKNKTKCTEGNAIACEEYETEDTKVLDSTGAPLISHVSCQKGEIGCSCKTDQNNIETCGQDVVQYQKTNKYNCKPEDQYQTCPYRIADEQVVDYEVEHTCTDVKVESKQGFLCFGGCSERHETQCNETKRTPVKAQVVRPNCFDPAIVTINNTISDPSKRLPNGTADFKIECKKPEYLCKRWSNNCTHYAVNESFQIVHEDIAPKWRPFNISKGEYPQHFEDQLFLKFVSPKGTVTNCPLAKFGRILKGNTLYIKIPDETNADLPCGVPLWSNETVKPLYLPKVFLKNEIHYPVERMCGVTEYSFLTQNIPLQGAAQIVPTAFQNSTVVHLGPVENSCRYANKTLVGADYWFEEVPPIRVKGRVSVLGRVFESLISGATE